MGQKSEVSNPKKILKKMYSQFEISQLGTDLKMLRANKNNFNPYTMNDCAVIAERWMATLSKFPVSDAKFEHKRYVATEYLNLVPPLVKKYSSKDRHTNHQLIQLVFDLTSKGMEYVTELLGK